MLDPVAFSEPASLLVLLFLAQYGSKLVAKNPAAFNLTYSLVDLRPPKSRTKTTTCKALLPPCYHFMSE